MWYLLASASASFSCRKVLYICSTTVVDSSRHSISVATSIKHRSSADMSSVDMSSADMSKHRNSSKPIILKKRYKASLCNSCVLPSLYLWIRCTVWISFYPPLWKAFKSVLCLVVKTYVPDLSSKIIPLFLLVITSLWTKMLYQHWTFQLTQPAHCELIHYTELPTVLSLLTCTVQ